ncbi:MAG TPA: hypothetical protein PLG79_12220 [Spirochaetales bacterium]|nr:hypothetical protein [Spirochaetales bacterium]
MHTLFSQIRESFWNEPCTLVLPSEVAARYFRLYLLEPSGKKALREDRVISWDTFKERSVERMQQRRPANIMYRTFFVQGLLEENRNRAEPLFSYLIRSEYRTSASRFEDTLVRLLPNLKELYQGVSTVSDTDSSVWPDKNEFFALCTDVDTLFHRYTDFLNQFSLFEPEYEEPVLLPPAEKTYVLFPEVIQDFPRFTKSFEKDRGTLQKVPLPRGKGSSPILWEYENSFQELRSTLVQIGKRIDRGWKEHELAVSFPAVREYREVL